ncbi:DUF2235 domain-containing protein [Facilibium subflavum]|uniref:DUF2235 domain-containing protein n=1 Tax=Facilibium subflavum TaxID=2219058 RepID=UPI000E645ED6|nr:DUF2235 domain-containing protein [Facilibium subflavum]
MKRCYIFFDGTGSNINSQQEQKIGRDIIAELFIHCQAEDIKPLGLNLLNINALPAQRNELAGMSDVKAYFPGPGAESCQWEGYTYKTPGGGDKKIFSEDIWSLNTINQLFGNGWLYNIHCAFQLVQFLNDEDNDTVFYILGYSRGAITAISLAARMAGANISVAYLALVDPVAGGTVGSVEKFNLEAYQGNRILPYKINSNVALCDIFYACTERRAEFSPQLPVKYIRKDLQSKPLLIDDQVNCYLHFINGDHKQIAYVERRHEKRICQAAIDVCNIIASRKVFDQSPYLFALSRQRDEYYEPDPVSKSLTYLPRTISRLWRYSGGSYYSSKYRANYVHDLEILDRIQRQSAFPIAKNVKNSDLIALVDNIMPTGWYSKTPFRTDRKSKWLKQIKADICFDAQEDPEIIDSYAFSRHYLMRIITVALVVRGGNPITRTGRNLLNLINGGARYNKFKKIIKCELYISNKHIAYHDLLTFTNTDLSVLADKDAKETLYNGRMLAR